MTAVTYALSNVKTTGLSNGIVCVMGGQGSGLQTLTETVRKFIVVMEISEILYQKFKIWDKNGRDMYKLPE